MTRAKLLQADTFHDGRAILFHGDCLSVLATMPENIFDSCVTDPPYHFASIIKRFAKTGGGDRSASRVGVYTRHARGFMGKEWDGGQIAHDPKTWEVVLRVLKPGAHLVAFGAPKNYHRLACAIEDAGFELRDSLLWLFGSGFPKSHDISKAIDAALGEKREVVGHYKGATNISHAGSGLSHDCYGVGSTKKSNTEVYITAPASKEAKQFDGWGTALKPAYEPIVLARKPLSESTIAANVIKWGTGALNIDGCRIGSELRSYNAGTPGGNTQRLHGGDGRDAQNARAYAIINKDRGLPEVNGRWPANVTHDGSDEVVREFPETTSGNPGDSIRNSKSFSGIGDSGLDKATPLTGFGDSGSAARFFYTAKADEAERYGSKHPTVKPLDLMQWLVRLVTPPNGTIIDPFAGTGTTAEAAIHEKYYCTLIEREAEYIEDIRTRMKYTRGFSQQERQKIFTRKAKDTGLLTFLNEGNK